MASQDGPTSLVDVFRDAQGASSQPAYMSHLTSLSLPQLLQEPATLASEASFLTSELTNLCHSQYQTFLSLHAASSALSDSFTSFSSSLSALVDAVPALEGQCTVFAKETKEMREDRRKVTTVLEQHEKLLDILEIPQLIDTCVKNGYYQEALDLAAHTNSLVKRFPAIPIIRSVEAEVAGSMNQMHSQLLQILQEPAKLPSLFKAINFLRRMDVLDEEELALAFLSSRGAYMKALFEAIERERSIDAARFLKKWIDLWREGLYDVVTQFTSIFLERPPPTSHSMLSADLRPFLTIFTHTMVQQLLQVLTQTVPQITDSPALLSLLTQLSYCSSSFSRIGLDFRALFPPIFETTVRDNFRKGVDEACSVLRASLDKALGSRRGTSIKLPASWMLVPDAIADPPVIPHSPSAGHSAFIPSSALVAYPPLALLLNALLTTFNSLRLLAPTPSLPSLLGILDDSLDRTSATLLEYLRQSLNRQRRSFDLNDSPEANEKEKLVTKGVSSAWFYLVDFVRRGLVEGVYNRSLSELESIPGSDVPQPPWRKDWEGWLVSQGMLDSTATVADDILSGKKPPSSPEVNGETTHRRSESRTNGVPAAKSTA